MTQARADPDANETHRPERHVVTFLAALGIMMAVGIDIALPAFGELRDAYGLDADSSTVSLVVTTYFFGMAAGQLVYGPVSDRFGRAPVVRFGLTLYAVGALVSALAPDFGVLLAARFVWGLGAAAPGVLRGAIARDLYSGDRMARVVTVMMAVFLLGPVFVPAVGQALVAVAPWQAVFVVPVVLATGMIVWSLRFGETLDPANRRPLEFRPLVRGARLVFTTRATVGHIVAQTLSSGAFIIFLGSGQPIIDKAYGREAQFALWFGASGVVSALALIVSNRLIARHGADRMVVGVGGALAAISWLGLIAVAGGAMRSFWVWLLWAYAVNALATVATPLCNALALDPMGHQAGTASAVLGFVTLAGGAALAAVFSSQVDTTATPMVVGSAVYTSLMLVALTWARRRPPVRRNGVGDGTGRSAARDRR